MSRTSRFVAGALLALTPLMNGDAKGAPPPPYWVCVTNERSGDLTLIDGGTRRVVATIALGKRPRGIHPGPDGRTLYVALSGSAISGPPGPGPAGPRAERPTPPPDRSADGIAVVDLGRRRLVRMIRVGVSPVEFALSRDGGRIYVSNEDAGTASVMRVTDGVVEKTIPVGPEPEGLAVAPDGRRIYVTCEASGEIAVLDARTNRLLTRWRVGGRPRSLAFLPDGSRAFVPSETDARLHVLDLALGRVLGTVALPAGARPMGTAMSEDGRELWVSNGRAGTVSVLNPRRGTLLGTVAVGARPWGLALSPDGKLLYVANGPSNDVSVIDRAARREVARIRAGAGPWGVAVVPGRGATAVASEPPPASGPGAEIDPESAAAAVEVVRDYYAAIEARDYRRAYRAWGEEGKASGRTYEEFAAGFSQTAHVRVDVGEPGRIEGAAGSRYVELPVTVLAVTRGGERQRFLGRYVLRRVVVDGASAAQRRWHIESARLRAGTA